MTAAMSRNVSAPASEAPATPAAPAAPLPEMPEAPVAEAALKDGRRPALYKPTRFWDLIGFLMK